MSYDGVNDERCVVFFFQAEDGIRDLVRSRGLGDVYKRQPVYLPSPVINAGSSRRRMRTPINWGAAAMVAISFLLCCCGMNRLCVVMPCLLYTSDAADERSSVDLGGRRIIKKKKREEKKKKRNKKKNSKGDTQIPTCRERRVTASTLDNHVRRDKNM